MAIDALKKGKSIFFTGPCGTGKSHFAYGLIGVWADSVRYLTEDEVLVFNEKGSWEGHQRSQKGARFLPSVELFHELKETFNETSVDTENNVISKYVRDDLLVIDDIGAEKVSEWSRQVFYLLIDRRYRDCRQTIYTSNLDLDQLKDVVDDRISSRLATCELIELNGEDGKGADWRVNHGE